MAKSKQDLIWYADSIPGNKPKITRVSKKDLGKKLGFVWSERFEFPPEFDEKYQAEFHKKLEVQIDQQHGEGTYRSLAKAESMMMLGNMGEFGHGVFAKEAIPERMPVAIYIGRFLHSKDTIQNQDYVHESLDNSQRVVDAREIRNIAGFFQHAPSKDNLLWVFSEDPTGKIVTANLSMNRFLIDQWEVLLLYTTGPVPANGMMCFDYNIFPWLHSGKNPACFTLEAKVYARPIVDMCPQQYRPIIWSINKLYFHLAQLCNWATKKIDSRDFLPMLSTLNHFAVMAGAFICLELSEVQSKQLFSNEVIADPRRFRIMFSTLLQQSKGCIEMNILQCLFLDAAIEFINHISSLKSGELKYLRRAFGKGQNDYEIIASILKNEVNLSIGIIMMIRYANLVNNKGMFYKTALLDKMYEEDGAFLIFARECLHPKAVLTHLNKAAEYKAMPVLPTDKSPQSPNLSSSRDKFLSSSSGAISKTEDPPDPGSSPGPNPK